MAAGGFAWPWAKERIETPIFGLLAEFASADDLLDAVRKSRAQGYRDMEAYTPMPLHEVVHELGYRSDLPKLVLAGGIVGGIFGFGLQYYASVVSYPIDVGSRPPNSWPAFIVIT